MKSLIMLSIFILFSFNVFAVDEIRLSYQISQNQDVNQVVFFVSKTSARRWQNSNYFSTSVPKLGEMKVEMDSTIKTKAYQRLKMILAHFDEMNAKLKKVNKTWNDLNTEGPHATIVKINNYKIPADSIYNKEITELMEKLLAQKTVLIDGVELVKANKMISYLKNSKTTKTEKFIQPFFCSKTEESQLCHIKDWGVLSISL